MVLAEIGKVMDGLYISLTGELEVQYADGRAPERFLAGTLFGQASLLTRRPSDVGIRAMSTMLVLRLPARAFQSAAMQYPGLLDRVSELASTSVAMIDS
jgi:CRP-like cAMP-binding protein